MHIKLIKNIFIFFFTLICVSVICASQISVWMYAFRFQTHRSSFMWWMHSFVYFEPWLCKIYVLLLYRLVFLFPFSRMCHFVFTFDLIFGSVKYLCFAVRCRYLCTLWFGKNSMVRIYVSAMTISFPRVIDSVDLCTFTFSVCSNSLFFFSRETITALPLLAVANVGFDFVTHVHEIPWIPVRSVIKSRIPDDTTFIFSER